MKLSIASSLIASGERDECDRAFVLDCLKALLNEASEYFDAIETILQRPGMTPEVFMAHVARSIVTTSTIDS